MLNRLVIVTNRTAHIKHTFKTEVGSKLVQCAHFPFSGLFHDEDIHVTHGRGRAIRPGRTGFNFYDG